MARCHSFCLFLFSTYIHSFNYIQSIQSAVAIRWGSSPSPHRQLGTELRLTLSEQSRTFLSYAATCWAMPHPTELRRTLLSFAAPYWATPHPTELRRTLLSYVAPCWATLHITEPFFLILCRRSLVSYLHMGAFFGFFRRSPSKPVFWMLFRTFFSDPIRCRSGTSDFGRILVVDGYNTIAWHQHSCFHPSFRFRISSGIGIYFIFSTGQTGILQKFTKRTQEGAALIRRCGVGSQ